jgi:arabinan endo-1,5-alpha-L-arabinosidase
MSYDDPATGKRLLYWGSGFGPIKVQELAPDRMSFAAGSAPIDLIDVVKTEDPADYRRLIEGAWVLKRGPWYYLFYSGDNCCGPKAHYATLVARSRSATGPFETLGPEKGAPSTVVALTPRWIAPGHNSIAEDGAGNHWILYHAVDARRPRNKPGDDINTRRVMLIDRLEWQDGWPRLASGAPTETPQPRPSLSR